MFLNLNGFKVKKFAKLHATSIALSHRLKPNFRSLRGTISFPFSPTPLHPFHYFSRVYATPINQRDSFSKTQGSNDFIFFYSFVPFNRIRVVVFSLSTPLTLSKSYLRKMLNGCTCTNLASCVTDKKEANEWLPM